MPTYEYVSIYKSAKEAKKSTTSYTKQAIGLGAHFSGSLMKKITLNHQF